MHHTSFAVLGSLVLATLTSSAPMAKPQEQEPLTATYKPHERTPEDDVTIQSLGFQPAPDTRTNRTCAATDTDCVVGTMVEKREAKPEAESIPSPTLPQQPAPEGEYVLREASPDETLQRRQASQGLQEAMQNAGIDDLQNRTKAGLQENTERISGVCKASDVECVAKKRAIEEKIQAEKRQSQTLQQASQAAGITGLMNNTQTLGSGPQTGQPGEAPSGSPSGSGVCKASDTECVVAKIKGKFRRGFRMGSYASGV